MKGMIESVATHGASVRIVSTFFSHHQRNSHLLSSSRPRIPTKYSAQMEAQNIQEVVKKAFGVTSPSRGRLFVTCITNEHIMIVQDGRRLPDP